MLSTSLFALFLSITISCPNLVHCQRNNVCDNPLSYSIKQWSPRCHYDPDVSAYMPELVTRHGFKLRTYTVTTQDGYILTLFNIPRENAKGVVLLQHPAYLFSHSWVDKGPVSLGFALFNAGYDVWLGNYRGTYYSRRHTTLNPDKDFLQFWNFTFHEMAVYDTPTQIDFILWKTHAKQLTFIGHSMAGTTAAIYAALLKEHAERYVRKFIIMGPAILCQYYFTFFQPLANWAVPLFYDFFKNTPLVEILRHNGLLHRLSSFMCNSSGTAGIVGCQNFAGFATGGRHFNIIDWRQVPAIIDQGFSGMSAKVFSHYFQNAGRTDKKLAFYNYGKQLNRLYYNSDEPPLYPFERINSSMHLMVGTHDLAGTYQDSKDFYEILVRNSGVKQSFATLKCGHGDFLYANNLEEKINRPIVKILNSIHP